MTSTPTKRSRRLSTDESGPSERHAKSRRHDCQNPREVRICVHGNYYAGDTNVSGHASLQQGDTYGDITSANAAQAEKEREKEFKDLLDSLHFDRMDFRANSVGKGLVNTCGWLLEHPTFRRWFDIDHEEHNAFFWLKGHPGCGKSTLMKWILDWARKYMTDGNERTLIVPYFFNARAADSLEKSSLGLYRTVVHQLLTNTSALRHHFTQKFAARSLTKTPEPWTASELQDFLADAVDSGEAFHLCLFIDALDEAELQDDARDMVQFLIELSDRASASGTRSRMQICLSSRHYPQINIGRALSLTVEKEPQHGRDIRRYIKKTLTCSEGPETIRLRSEIYDKSSNIFLWVVLVVKILNKLNDKGASVSAMQYRLKTVPSDLKRFFHEILAERNNNDRGNPDADDGDEQDIEDSVSLFRWVLFSRRPLEPNELYVALSYSTLRDVVDGTSIPVVGNVVPNSDRLERYLIDRSRGLVEIAVSGFNGYRTVLFIHETVREYLLKEGLSAFLRLPLDNVKGTSHEVLRLACLHCVSSTTIPDKYKRYLTEYNENHARVEAVRQDIHKEITFLEYATRNQFYHAEQAQINGIDQRDALQLQIDSEGRWLQRQCRFWAQILINYKSYTELVSFMIQERHMRIAYLVFTMTKQADDMHALYYDLLQLAVFERCWSAVYSLRVDHSKFLGKPGRLLWKLDEIMFRAVEDGFRTEVTSLLEMLHPKNTIDLLYDASEHGFKTLVQILLDIGADANARRGELYGNALQAAAFHGHLEVVRLLLEHGATVDAQGGPNDNALQAAVYTGHLDVVRLLLEHGADVNAQGRPDGSALQAAASYGHLEVVRLLLEHGADVNAQGGPDGSALQAAASYGHLEVARLLLEHGADHNAQGGPDGSALQLAARFGHSKIVQPLLAHGADVHAQGRYGMALERAPWWKHKDVVKVLQATLDPRSSSIEEEQERPLPRIYEESDDQTSSTRGIQGGSLR